MKNKYLIVKSLKTPYLKYGFFTRKGGLSKKKFSSLNCSLSSYDNKKNVKKNIKIALKELELSNKKIKLVNQIHSNKIVEVNLNNLNKKHIADGIITTSKDLSLAVLTADCAPIFIFDKNNKIICCIHAGWKGTLNNIVKQGIKIFKKNKINIKDIIAIIGPCLSKKNYEVDLDFKKKFIRKNHSYNNFFKNKNNKKELFDLRGIINYQLIELGVKNLYNIKKDTFSNDSIFFSHRRSTINKEYITGRMINIIGFK